MKKNLKVLHVLNELRPSGAETMLESAAGVFSQAGLESHILSTGTTVGIFAPTLMSAGYTVHHIPFKRYAIFTSPSYLFSYLAFLRRERFEVVHVHPERGNFFHAAFARLAGALVVRTVHHIFPQPLTLTGVLFRIVRTIQRWALCHAFCVKTVSNSRSGWENERKTYYTTNLLIPNWYDNRRFTPSTTAGRKEARDLLGFGDDLFVVVSLGGNWEYKNYDLVVRALAVLPDGMPVRYVQVGPQGEGNPLETLARELHVSTKVQCVGVVPDPVKYLHAADVYVMPSSVEGFGCAAAEAMGCALPAILAYSPGLKDFQEHCPGIVYAEPNVDSIVLAILRVAALSLDQRRAIGLELSNQISRHYGIQAGASEYLRLYLHQ